MPGGVLTQEQIDALLAGMLADTSVLPNPKLKQDIKNNSKNYETVELSDDGILKKSQS